MNRAFAILVLLLACVLPATPACAETVARTLPFWSELAGDQKLPLPYGISLLGYWQDHGYDLTKLEASSALDPRIGQVAGMLDPAMIDVDNEVAQVGVKGDVWLLPFLNLSALLGYVDGQTDIDFGALRRQAAAGTCACSMAQEVLALLDAGLDVDYSGFLYGGGATLAWGIGPVFGALNGIATWAALEDDASVRAYIVRPLVGVRVDRFSVWTGAMYQDAQERHKGSLQVPGLGSVSYDVKLDEKEPWNWIVGAGYEFSERWGLTLEGGFGERTQCEAALTRRF